MSIELKPASYKDLHRSLRDAIEDEFMYDFYRAPNHQNGGVWHIAFDALRRRALIALASGGPAVKLKLIEAISAEDALKAAIGRQGSPAA